MLIGGKDYTYDAPFRKDIRWKSKTVRKEVTSLVVHESGCLTETQLFRALGANNLDIHASILPDGTLVQYEDLAHPAWHAKHFNGKSFGCELLTPYYPKNIQGLKKENNPWNRGFSAKWVHRGVYVCPTEQQLEAVTFLIHWLLGPNDRGAVQVPWRWPGVLKDKDGKLYMVMGVVNSPVSKYQPGIWSHQQVGYHADGSFPLLYAYLRIELYLSVTEAFDLAVALSKAAVRGRAYIPNN